MLEKFDRLRGKPASLMQPSPHVQLPTKEDAPPAYDAVVNATSSAEPHGDDEYSFLREFDTVFIVDGSSSMTGWVWQEAGQAIQTIAPICTNVRNPEKVAEIFKKVRPRGGTPTGTRLDNILRPYLRRYQANPDETKPINIIVITDGAAQDEPEYVLIAAARKLDDLAAPAWQVGVQFFQVGHDKEASEHLRQLDDELGRISGDPKLRDMVDPVPFKSDEGGQLTGNEILKVVLGSVLRRHEETASAE